MGQFLIDRRVRAEARGRAGGVVVGGMLPEGARELPEDLARLDELLADVGLLAPIEAHWQREAEAVGRSSPAYGRPTISMQTFVRLMVVKHRTRWGYETLKREVADSFHLSTWPGADSN